MEYRRLYMALAKLQSRPPLDMGFEGGSTWSEPEPWRSAKSSELPSGPLSLAVFLLLRGRVLPAFLVLCACAWIPKWRKAASKRGRIEISAYHYPTY